MKHSIRNTFQPGTRPAFLVLGPRTAANPSLRAIHCGRGYWPDFNLSMRQLPLSLFQTIFLTALLCFGSLSNSQAQSYKQFRFQSGDLLFQDLDCGGLCDAIETVTTGVQGRHFSHIGLVYRRADSVFVIEAIGKDVHLTPLEKFLLRPTDKAQQPTVVVGRLKPAYQYLNKAAVRFALQQMGTLYDDVFLYNNGKYYCSELIYDAYKEANHGRPFFSLRPMTFKDPATGNTFPVWTQYYQDLHQPIPESKPGCNPGGISTSDKISIITSFYK